ncbi:MAG: hypothetical protein IJT34_02745 [Butyrivibrio sp.]|nr:hypothetical protein [Butyrivibrio sp.]
MLSKGDHVVYGNHGLCEVVDITVPSFLERGKEKLYYVMEASVDSKGVLYVPVEGAEERMREAIDAKVARALIDSLEELEVMDIPSGKKAEGVIVEVIRRNLSEEMMGLIKTLRKLKATREMEGKKFAMVDEKYLTIAEKLFYTEVAYSLQSDPETVKQEVCHGLEQLPLMA